jgi:hypothetical protein
MHIAKLLLPCLLLTAMAPQAKADCGDGLGLAYLFGFQNFNQVGQRSYNNNTPPYFALHPPVYYGQRYSRPYGVSPFAAWPQLQPNAAYAPQMHVDRSQTISNPHAVPVEGVSAPGVVVAEPVQPLIIENPYYTGEKVQYTAK